MKNDQFEELTRLFEDNDLHDSRSLLFEYYEVSNLFKIPSESKNVGPDPTSGNRKLIRVINPFPLKPDSMLFMFKSYSSLFLLI